MTHQLTHKTRPSTHETQYMTHHATLVLVNRPCLETDAGAGYNKVNRTLKERVAYDTMSWVPGVWVVLGIVFQLI